MNSLLLKQTYEMIVWGGNKRLLGKRKIRWYTIAHDRVLRCLWGWAVGAEDEGDAKEDDKGK